MRLVCPSCTATYQVADDIVPQSGQIRCARCGAEWRIERPASHVMPPARPEPGPERPPAIEERAPLLHSASSPQWPDEPLPKILPPEPGMAGPASRQRRNIRAAWVLSVMVIAILVTTVFVVRADIQRVWPPSTRFFQLFGA